MSRVSPTELRRPAHEAMAWYLALAGFAAMYLPVYGWAAQDIWQSEDHGHGPLVLAVIVWLFWGLRHELAAAPHQPAALSGWPVFMAGVLVYFVGRVFGISILEFGSQPLVVAGALLLMKGPHALRLAWFPLVYFVFMVPLPGMFVDAVTGTLKLWIADIVDTVLYSAGYPMGRTGVMLSIGPYQLQVADACSGLHSMFSLSALGTLFMYMMGRKRKLHMAIMLASILPIAFVANVIRVITLILVTYYLGDEAGQGFLHGAAGLVLMLVALVSFFLLDLLLDKLLPAKASAPS